MEMENGAFFVRDGDGEWVGERLMGNEKEEMCNNQSLTTSCPSLNGATPPQMFHVVRDNGGVAPG